MGLSGIPDGNPGKPCFMKWRKNRFIVEPFAEKALASLVNAIMVLAVMSEITTSAHP